MLEGNIRYNIEIGVLNRSLFSKWEARSLQAYYGISKTMLQRIRSGETSIKFVLP